MDHKKPFRRECLTEVSTSYRKQPYKKVAESPRKLYVRLVIDETSSDKLKSVKSVEI